MRNLSQYRVSALLLGDLLKAFSVVRNDEWNPNSAGDAYITETVAVGKSW